MVIQLKYHNNTPTAYVSRGRRQLKNLLLLCLGGRSPEAYVVVVTVCPSVCLLGRGHTTSEI